MKGEAQMLKRVKEPLSDPDELLQKGSAFELTVKLEAVGLTRC